MEICCGPNETRFHTIHRFASLDSTNTYLLEFAATHSDCDVVAIAKHQTAGRGRRGRTWDDAPGDSFLCSVLLADLAEENTAWSTQAVALSVIDACAVVANVQASAKWPNDVMVGDAKLAGILAQRTTLPTEDGRIVVGCGVNLNGALRLREVFGEAATSLDAHTQAPISLEMFEDAYLRALHERLSRPAWLLDAFRSRCTTIGQLVRIDLGVEEIVGVATAINDDGSLCVQSDDVDVVRNVFAGDVVHLRPPTMTVQ